MVTSTTLSQPHLKTGEKSFNRIAWELGVSAVCLHLGNPEGTTHGQLTWRSAGIVLHPSVCRSAFGGHARQAGASLQGNHSFLEMIRNEG